jgi:hypothetical protein
MDTDGTARLAACLPRGFAPDGIIAVIDRQHFFAIESDLHHGFVLQRQPESIYLLILPHKIRALDPERQIGRRMPFDPYHREVLAVDPHIALEQVLDDPPGRLLPLAGANANVIRARVKRIRQLRS